MSEPFGIEAQGDHQYVVRLRGEVEEVESWVELSPDLLDRIGVAEDDEEAVVRHTVRFLLRHQDVPDFPRIVDLEDVIASYPDYLDDLPR
ncbi:hypothetical protein DQ238_04375 [Geodermatophilus sp. TF02-6]|uniref:hypothetical protein n=1 Tax=Geodermatophilus sp. TF02-6 TaxID=2250575 RepID=UPI000DE93A9A|nr:hypothetical protein [Geodermatophilus sp. TF02-6]RBY82525.1 hypothetical protein DQ238_04375 [Geodermatophilus sp. TF02-6]